jgi:hypothetical protein
MSGYGRPEDSGRLTSGEQGFLSGGCLQAERRSHVKSSDTRGNTGVTKDSPCTESLHGPEEEKCPGTPGETARAGEGGRVCSSSEERECAP